MTTDKKHIHHAIIYRPLDAEILVNVPLTKSRHKKEVSKVIRLLERKPLQTNERQKIVSKRIQGKWWAECESGGLVILVLIHTEFPQYLGGQILKDIRRGLKRVPEYAKLSPEQFRAKFEDDLESLLIRYDRLEDVDALSRANKKADLAKIGIRNNIFTVLQQNEKLEVREKLKNLEEVPSGLSVSILWLCLGGGVVIRL